MRSCAPSLRSGMAGVLVWRSGCPGILPGVPGTGVLPGVLGTGVLAFWRSAWRSGALPMNSPSACAALL